MRISEHLDIEADDFFDQLLESIAYDYQEATGKKLGRARLKSGLTYTKHLQGRARGNQGVKVKVMELTRPSVYEVTFSSQTGVNTMSYRIEPAAAGGIDVTYEETFEGGNLMANFNQRLMGTLLNRGGKKRVRELLHAIERHVKNEAEEAAEAEALPADASDGGEGSPAAK